MTRKCLSAGLLAALTASGLSAADVRAISVRSELMGKDVPVSVILPNGYGASDVRHPVVYMLHGAGNDHKTYVHEPILSLVDRYRVLVVCPYGGGSWWIDSPVLPRMRYESFVTRELVPYVDAAFRTRPDRTGRAIVGHSMGGHGACFIGFRNKDTFAAVGNVMGGVDLRPFASRADLRKLLGDPREQAGNWGRFSAISEASKLRNGDIQLTTVVGTGDFFFGVNRAMHELLSSNRVAHAHLEIRGADDEHSKHTWTFAYEAMPFVFGRIMEVFANANGK